MSASFNLSTPPPPPPPKSAQQQSQCYSVPHSSLPGPPLPPPLPTPYASEQNPVTLPRVLPPSPEDFWLPEAVLSISYVQNRISSPKLGQANDTRTLQLQALLSDSVLLAALLNAPSTAHPSLLPSPLQPHLEANQKLATQIIAQHTHLLSLRASTQSRLLQLHALERQWRSKQALMDSALAPWSPKALYQRVGQFIAESDSLCEALEESFVEGGGDGGFADGKVGERELTDFVKRYREGRKGAWKMKEGRARWDEGRVGGWR